MRKAHIVSIALTAACALPVMAQTSGTTSSPQTGQAATATQSAPDTRTESRGEDRDLGWLGLLGLAGLLGLRRRHPDDHTRTRDNPTASHNVR
jgi:MYXO-CTERM domain-containing protein